MYSLQTNEVLLDTLLDSLKEENWTENQASKQITIARGVLSRTNEFVGDWDREQFVDLLKLDTRLVFAEKGVVYQNGINTKVGAINHLIRTNFDDKFVVTVTDVVDDLDVPLVKPTKVASKKYSSSSPVMNLLNSTPDLKPWQKYIIDSLTTEDKIRVIRGF